MSSDYELQYDSKSGAIYHIYYTIYNNNYIVTKIESSAGFIYNRDKKNSELIEETYINLLAYLDEWVKHHHYKDDYIDYSDDFRESDFVKYDNMYSGKI